MGPVSILLLSIALAMDSLTVSICSGMTMDSVRLRDAARIALFFGGFQALMPVLGWAGGLTVRDLIASFDHWVAFGLLAVIGGRMIHEGLQAASCERRICPTSLAVLTTLAVATSIDALAVGLSFAAIGASITVPVITIGIVTAALSLGGVYLGRHGGALLQNKAAIAGGLILIGIGARIVAEHYGLPVSLVPA